MNSRPRDDDPPDPGDVERYRTRVEEFERELFIGHVGRIEQFLTSQEITCLSLLERLLQVEIEYRGKRGDVFELMEYVDRFPQIADHSDLVERLTRMFEQSVARTSENEIFRQLPFVFGRFEVQKELGSGAMGTVYLAFDPTMNRQVALKIPKLEANEDPQLLERFLREARATNAMNHPNICGMYEFGQIGGTCFIVMEYIDGRPLHDYIKPNLPQHQIALLIRRLALALAHAHECGFIHRDLKPSNVMIASNGVPKVMDFGLVRRFGESGDLRLTQSNMLVGSPAYMSPEQARGENATLTPASDIYSLGTMFFESLTGELPFKGSMASVLGKIAMLRAPKPSTIRPDVDSQLESLCLMMLEKKPHNRPVSMNFVAASLLDWIRRSRTENEAPATADVQPDESVTLVPVKPLSPRVVAVGDAIETKKRRVTELINNKHYGAAIVMLKELVKITDPHFGSLVAWARPLLVETRAIDKKLRNASAPMCAAAKQFIEMHDYAGAVQVLEEVPAAYRSAELRELLANTQELREESDHLLQDIDDAIRQNEPEPLPGLVKRLRRLKPGDKIVKQLSEELKTMGAAEVIALRKGYRRSTDLQKSTKSKKNVNPEKEPAQPPRSLAMWLIFSGGLLLVLLLTFLFVGKFWSDKTIVNTGSTSATQQSSGSLK